MDGLACNQGASALAYTHRMCLGREGYGTMGSVRETHLHPVALLPGKSAVTVGEHKLCGGDDRPADATALSALWAGRRMVARRHARWTTAAWLCEERLDGRRALGTTAMGASGACGAIRQSQPSAFDL